MESHCFHLLERQIRWGAGLVAPKNTISPHGISWHFFLAIHILLLFNLGMKSFLLQFIPGPVAS